MFLKTKGFIRCFAKSFACLTRSAPTSVAPDLCSICVAAPAFSLALSLCDYTSDVYVFIYIYMYICVRDLHV